MKKNGVASILFSIGILIIIIAFFVGYFFGNAIGDKFLIALALPWWIGGFISGILFLGFSEVIKLLQEISNKMDKDDEDEETEDDEIEGKVFKGIKVDSSEIDEIVNIAVSENEINLFRILGRQQNKIFLEISYSDIQSIKADETVKDQFIVIIKYKDEFGHIQSVGFHSIKNSEAIGNEIFNMVKHYSGK